MLRGPPLPTRTDTLCPYPTLCRSWHLDGVRVANRGQDYTSDQHRGAHPDRRASLVDGERPPTAIGREIVRDDRDRGRAKASLAQTDTSAGDKKFDEIIRARAADRHHIPEDNADEDDPPPVAAKIGRASCRERVCQYG